MEHNVDEDGVQVRAVLDKAGNEVGDPVPMAPPLHMTRPLSLSEQIKQMVRRELSEVAHNQGFETFEESDDFDIDDDPLDPQTPYEAVFDPPPPAADEELKDASASSVERRNEPVGDGSRKSGAVVEDKSKPQPDVSGSGSKAGGGDPGSEK